MVGAILFMFGEKSGLEPPEAKPVFCPAFGRQKNSAECRWMRRVGAFSAGEDNEALAEARARRKSLSPINLYAYLFYSYFIPIDNLYKNMVMSVYSFKGLSYIAIS